MLGYSPIIDTFVQDEVLNNFYKLSPPPQEAIQKRDEQIALLKQQLGHKYLLDKPLPRIQ